MADHKTAKPIVASGVVLGIGMGGFIDGIVLHQIVQAHSMLSGKLPPTSMENMRINMTADGIFHAFVWIVTFAGIIMLFNAGRRSDIDFSGRALAGGMIMGWGLFNVVEGFIDHQILGLHHVIERLGLSIWDWLFVAVSVVMFFVGRMMTRTSRAVD